MATAKLTSKGQITIPKQVRSTLGVETGDRLEFTIGRGGAVTLRAAKPQPAAGLVGLLERYRKARPVSIAEMNAAVRNAAGARARRSK